jgi:YHS domain-containing protein
LKPLAALVLLAASLPAAAAAAAELRLEDCIPEAGERPAVEVEYAGKTYGLRSEDCRALFESDPERYSQLYEALLELAKLGQEPPKKDAVSLVPS